MNWFQKTERQKWGMPLALSRPQQHIGLPALGNRCQQLYGQVLPRGVLAPRFVPDRPPVNHWMRPNDLAAYEWQPGDIMLGKFGKGFIGFCDDRPMVTIAGARAGKTSTVLEPNLYLYPGSMLVLDPKGELTERTAALRRAIGHDVYVLDPFGQSGVDSSSFNALSELDPDSLSIIDDVASIAQALIIDDGDARSRHWIDSARTLLKGIILLTLLLPEEERNLITVKQLLSLNHPRLVNAVNSKPRRKGEPLDEEYYDENKVAVNTLLTVMTNTGDKFGGILAGIGNRLSATPHTERSGFFSTAAAQTDFLDSLPLRQISMKSDFRLSSLRSARPTTIYLCLPVGRMESHFRWLRLIVQMACTVLEKMGTYPRGLPPILFMMEEFAVLQHMDIMEKAAAYFPGFGVKLWAVLQDLSQLARYYERSSETFLGNAGLVQCFANGDQYTLDYLARRLEKLMAPFELRSAFSRQRHTQLLLFEGQAPAAAARLEHDIVMNMRVHAVRWAERVYWRG